MEYRYIPMVLAVFLTRETMCVCFPELLRSIGQSDLFMVQNVPGLNHRASGH